MYSNWITYLILFSVIAHWVIDSITVALNLSSLSPVIPEEFEAVYNADEYAKSQRYTRAKSSFGLKSSAYSLMTFLILWFSGAFNIMDVFVRSFGFSIIFTGIFYIMALSSITYLLELPFSIYSTFVLEEEFGFNKTTAKTFVLDQLKSLGLAIVLGGPLIAALVAFIQYTGPSSWLYCWVFVSIFSLVMFYVAPKYILPLFNTLTLLDDQQLLAKIKHLAGNVNFSFGSIFLMDGSKRSGHSNAFFAGIGNSKRIVLFDTLIAKQTPEEIIAILGHEMGHYKLGHVYTSLLITMAHTFGLFFAMSIFISNDDLFKAFFIGQKSVYTGMFLFSHMLAPVEFAMQLLMTAFSRHNEFAADQFAVNAIDNPEDLVSGLKKLSVDNLSNLTPHWLLVALTYTHPPVIDRIQAIRLHAAKKAKRL
uniref:CAAX prenyl protease n=1 Tax=Spongospora subterranea TaxID=70186 RepID=A0A0H5R466_9EUKA|eukprot:CRZ08995.1 hypothetical protein [Spongospora subterranea]